MNADQWSYYYAQLPGRSAISAQQFGSLFFPNGRPSDPSQYQQYTAVQWASIAAGGGLSGLGAQVVGNPYDYQPGAQPGPWQQFMNWLQTLFGGGSTGSSGGGPIGGGPIFATHLCPTGQAWDGAQCSPTGPILPPPPIHPALLPHGCTGPECAQPPNIPGIVPPSPHPMWATDPANLLPSQLSPQSSYPAFPGVPGGWLGQGAAFGLPRYNAVAVSPAFVPGTGIDVLTGGTGPQGGGGMPPDTSGLMGLGDDIGYPAWAIHGGTRG